MFSHLYIAVEGVSDFDHVLLLGFEPNITIESYNLIFYQKLGTTAQSHQPLALAREGNGCRTMSPIAI
jgi:hypothetical protein